MFTFIRRLQKKVLTFFLVLILSLSWISPSILLADDDSSDFFESEPWSVDNPGQDPAQTWQGDGTSSDFFESDTWSNESSSPTPDPSQVWQGDGTSSDFFESDPWPTGQGTLLSAPGGSLWPNSDGTTSDFFESDPWSTTSTPAFASSCAEDFSDQYPQCGGTLGLEDRNPSHIFMVTRVKDCNGNILRYTNSDLGQSDQCGVAPQTAPAPVCTEAGREYPQCGGTIGLENFPNTDTILVTELTNSCDGTKRFEHRNLGNRGECARAAAPAPATSVAFPTATPTPFPIFVTPTPVPAAIPTAAPVVVAVPRGAAVSCPSGTVFGGINGSNIICVQQSQTQTQSSLSTSNASTGAINITLAGNPQSSGITPVKTVLVAGATELPKTGLPLAAWSLGGLFPLGIKLRKWGHFAKKSTESAHYLWQKREWGKG